MFLPSAEPGFCYFFLPCLYIHRTKEKSWYNLMLYIGRSCSPFCLPLACAVAVMVLTVKGSNNQSSKGEPHSGREMGHCTYCALSVLKCKSCIHHSHRHTSFSLRFKAIGSSCGGIPDESFWFDISMDC